MKITKVCCQGCGADLEVDEEIRFVNCNYCGAKLEVVHDATTTHTRSFVSMINGSTKAGAYQEALARMEARRRSLIAEIEKAKR